MTLRPRQKELRPLGTGSVGLCSGPYKTSRPPLHKAPGSRSRGGMGAACPHCPSSQFSHFFSHCRRPSLRHSRSGRRVASDMPQPLPLPVASRVGPLAQHVPPLGPVRFLKARGFQSPNASSSKCQSCLTAVSTKSLREKEN